MSGMFQALEGGVAILVTGGVYKEAPLFRRSDGSLYAKLGSGFVRLNSDGSTSAGSKCRIDTLSCDDPLFVDRFGKLGLLKLSGMRPVQEPRFELMAPTASDD